MSLEEEITRGRVIWQTSRQWAIGPNIGPLMSRIHRLSPVRAYRIPNAKKYILNGPNSNPMSRASTHKPSFWPRSCSKNKSFMIAIPTVAAGDTPKPWRNRATWLSGNTNKVKSGLLPAMYPLKLLATAAPIVETSAITVPMIKTILLP